MKKLFIPLLFLLSCAKVKEAPVNEFYVVNLVDKLCTRYPITDKENLKFGEPTDLPLEETKECDRLVGVKREDWAALKNWIRDQIEKSKRNELELPGG